MNKNEILKQYFGYDSFRKGQEILVDGILAGRDTLGIMPTGAGKSLCFQVPAMLQRGITLVISPLISLMQDQVKGLSQAGISAAYLNSSLSQRQMDMALYNAARGQYRIIYVAPERLLTEGFLSFCREVEISIVAVDEAHCISQWGQDFRPSYAQIPQFIALLGKRPIVTAFTATATQRVREDIVRLLEMESPLIHVSGFDRENLFFEVREPGDKLGELLGFLEERKDASGIIYCSTRKAVEQVGDYLVERGYSAGKYHAGLGQEERWENQRAFVFDEMKIMVATNAFGMGIDKSNVAFVVHYNMPKDMESYYQEAGRAGRDGAAAHCLLLYSGGDVVTQKFIIENATDMTYESPEMERQLKNQAYSRLRDMCDYASTSECLRTTILRYFGENPLDFCGNCGNCLGDFEVIDATVEAQKIISCIIRMGERYGRSTVIEVLRGSKNKKLKQLGFDELSTYGISKESAERLKIIIDQLVLQGYLIQVDGQYPLLMKSLKSGDILRNRVNFQIKIPKAKMVLEQRQKTSGGRDVPAGREDLFQMLRGLREQVARSQGIPGFLVFGDASLLDMCRKLPRTKETFLAVSGVGQAKLDAYGERFTALIGSYCQENGIEEVVYSPQKKSHRAKAGEALVVPSFEMICEIKPANEPVSVSVIAQYCNDMLSYYGCTTVSAVRMANWLVDEGYLEIATVGTGKTKVPTEKGFASGITQEERQGRDGAYRINLYSVEMQEKIIASISSILAMES